jgi:hypothetical protein
MPSATSPTVIEPRSLTEAVEVDLEGCEASPSASRIFGTVTNNSDKTVDVYVHIYLENDGGVGAGEGTFVYGLPPGQSARWERESTFGSQQFDRCSASVDSVYETPPSRL